MKDNEEAFDFDKLQGLDYFDLKINYLLTIVLKMKLKYRTKSDREKKECLAELVVLSFYRCISYLEQCNDSSKAGDEIEFICENKDNESITKCLKTSKSYKFLLDHFSEEKTKEAAVQ